MRQVLYWFYFPQNSPFHGKSPIVGWQATQKCDVKYIAKRWISSSEYFYLIPRGPKKWCLNLYALNKNIVKKNSIFFMINFLNKPLFGACQPTTKDVLNKETCTECNFRYWNVDSTRPWLGPRMSLWIDPWPPIKGSSVVITSSLCTAQYPTLNPATWLSFPYHTAYNSC